MADTQRPQIDNSNLDSFIDDIIKIADERKIGFLMFSFDEADKATFRTTLQNVTNADLAEAARTFLTDHDLRRAMNYAAEAQKKITSTPGTETIQ